MACNLSLTAREQVQHGPRRPCTAQITALGGLISHRAGGSSRPRSLLLSTPRTRSSAQHDYTHARFILQWSCEGLGADTTNSVHCHVPTRQVPSSNNQSQQLHVSTTGTRNHRRLYCTHVPSVSIETGPIACHQVEDR